MLPQVQLPTANETSVVLYKIIHMPKMWSHQR